MFVSFEMKVGIRDAKGLVGEIITLAKAHPTFAEDGGKAWCEANPKLAELQARLLKPLEQLQDDKEPAPKRSSAAPQEAPSDNVDSGAAAG